MHIYTDKCTCNQLMILTHTPSEWLKCKKNLSSHVSAHGSGACCCDYGTREFVETQAVQPTVSLVRKENVLHEMTCHGCSRIENDCAKECMKVPTCWTKEKSRNTATWAGTDQDV